MRWQGLLFCLEDSCISGPSSQSRMSERNAGNMMQSGHELRYALTSVMHFGAVIGYSRNYPLLIAVPNQNLRNTLAVPSEPNEEFLQQNVVCQSLICKPQEKVRSSASG